MTRTTPRVRALEARFGKPIAQIIADAFNEHGNADAAARELGVSRQAFEIWFWKYGVRVEKRAIIETPILRETPSVA